MTKHSKIFAGLMVGIASVAMSTAVWAADISGAGATFPFPIYAKWAAVYKGQTGTGLNYQSIGSGGGIKQIESKTVTFGATDMPLLVPELNKYGLAQFPAVIGGIVPVVNIPGISPDQLVLDGPTLANIFLGNVSNWSDPAIKKLNPGVNLPNMAIAVVHRSDGSGTTFNFTNYLSKVSKEWDSRVGAATAVDWPVGIGAKGNEFIASNVAGTRGAIGYVEFAYAKQNKLTYTRMINKDGKTVSLSIPTMQAAAAGAKWDSPLFRERVQAGVADHGRVVGRGQRYAWCVGTLYRLGDQRRQMPRIVQDVGVEIDDIVLQPLAAAEGVLTSDDYENGVVLVEMGAGTTCLAFMAQGNTWHTAVIPVGGQTFNTDIAITFQMSRN